MKHPYFPLFRIALGLLLAHILSTTVYAVDGQKKLVFAIDGLSYESFQLAKSKGLFPSFKNAGRHIAPYPSMTEPSWTEIMGGKELFPLQGDVKTIEASYFDREKMQLVDDPRNVFTRSANPYNFFRAFSYYFNPFLEGLMYFPNEGINDMELDQIEKDAADHLRDDHYVIYVSSVDAIAHTQKDALYKHLVKVSATVEKVLEMHRRAGISVAAWIISDHGNEGAFLEGKPESWLKPVDLEPIAARAGLKISEGRLTGANEIAIPVLALANVANVYFKDLSKRRALAKAALSSGTMDIATFLEQDGKQFYIVVMDDNGGEARISWSSQGYFYHPLRGNPLRIASEFQSRWVSDADMFRATAPGHYPDSIHRIVQGAAKQVENFPDLILNFKRGFMVKGNFLKFVNMARTHGSLDAGSSNGLLASSGRPVPAFVRSTDVMKVIGLRPDALFHGVDDLFHDNPRLPMEKSMALKSKGIATRVTEFSNDMIFRRLGKIVSATMDFLAPEDAVAIKEGLNFKSSEQDKGKADAVADALKKIDPKTVLQNIDSFLALKDIATSTKDTDEMITKMKQAVLRIPGMGPLGEIEGLAKSSAEDDEKLKKSANAVRKAAMKLYAAPFVLNEVLNIPEFDYVKDARDLSFASRWQQTEKNRIRQNPVSALDGREIPQKLFESIFEERRQFQALYPATFPLLYNPPSQDVTVVFVPGIYNELFDTEIFSKGLRAIRENLGMRVLYVDVDGRCSSEFNSQRILEQLKEDTRKRMERAYSKPRYLILGYSKGGVDTSEMLLLDPEFTRSQVLGLVSIASPLHGTQIVESADLPAGLLDRVVERPLPRECRSEPASKSLLRVKRSQFWAKNVAQLAELTRFYSLSFSSSMENSHPWMKITKNIARFQVPNDGVVTVESSKFPEALGAVDLGTVNADHLAGILASSFPQGPFMESIVLTLLEMNAFSPANLNSWHKNLAVKSQALLPDYYKRRLAEQIFKADQAGAKPLVNAMGPFPASDTSRLSEEEVQDVDYWYSVIAKERAILKSPLVCGTEKEMSDLAKRIHKFTEDDAFALKPFSLSCTKDGKVLLNLQTYSRPFYKVWESNAYDQVPVRTLEDLVQELLKRGLQSGKNLLESGEAKPMIPRSSRAPIALPESSMKWSPDTVLEIKNLGNLLAEAKVQPMLPEQYASASILFDQQTAQDFRKEYGFFYESTAPGNIDDNSAGYLPVMDKIDDAELPALRMRSENNSIRMTTAAFRFRPADFPNLSLKLKVNKGPRGADPAKGGSGKDDSAFQVWFNLRSLHGVQDRSKLSADSTIKIFGYYWDEDQDNPHPADQLFENYYSNKNFVIAVLPEAWQISLAGGAKSLGQWFGFKRNLLEDIRKAFPKERAEDFEVVGITFQTDSNDTKSSSEALFRELKFSRQ